MALTYLTRLKPEPKGVYDAAAAYEVNSLVTSADGATTYLSVKEVPAGTALTDTEYWTVHTDLSAAKESAETAAQQALQAAEEAGATEEKLIGIIKNLTNPVSAEGNPVQLDALVGGVPFDSVVTTLEPVQDGEGDPAPDNIRPISGWTGAELVRCGKNLLNPKINTDNNYAAYADITNDGRFYVNNTTTAKVYPRSIAYALPAGQYNLQTYGVADSIEIYVQSTEGDYSQKITSASTNLLLTVEENQEFWLLIVVPAGLEDSFSVWLSEGDASTDFEAYQSETFSHDFGDTVYGGTLDWQTGLLTVDRAVKTFDGTETGWYLSSTDYTYALQNPASNMLRGNLVKLVCSHYRLATTTSEIDSDDGIGSLVQYNNVGWYINHDAQALGVDGWKSYLAAQYAAGTPVQVCYTLATPAEIQLTAQELTQLDGANTLYGDGSIAVQGRQRADGAKYELIESITMEEAAAISRTLEPDGMAYNFSAVMVRIIVPRSVATLSSFIVSTYIGDSYLNAYVDAVSNNTTERDAIVWTEQDRGWWRTRTEKVSAGRSVSTASTDTKPYSGNAVTKISTTGTITAGVTVEIWGVRA